MNLEFKTMQLYNSFKDYKGVLILLSLILKFEKHEN